MLSPAYCNYSLKNEFYKRKQLNYRPFLIFFSFLSYLNHSAIRSPTCHAKKKKTNFNKNSKMIKGLNNEILGSKERNKKEEEERFPKPCLPKLVETKEI